MAPKKVDPLFTNVNETGLENFRAAFLNTLQTLKLLRLHSVYLKISMGVGKTTLADDILVNSSTFKEYDVVLYISPTHALIDERVKVIRQSYLKKKYIVLNPRPRKRCGSLNNLWLQYEVNGLSLQGKTEICNTCPKRSGCKWRKSLGQKIRGKKIILLTEQHLANDPGFYF